MTSDCIWIYLTVMCSFARKPPPGIPEASQTVGSSEVCTLVSLFLTCFLDDFQPNGPFRGYNATLTSGSIGGS